MALQGPPTRAWPFPAWGALLELKPSHVEEAYWNSRDLKRRIIALDALSRTGLLLMHGFLLVSRPVDEGWTIRELRSGPDLALNGPFSSVLTVLATIQTLQLALIAAFPGFYYAHRTALLLFSRLACAALIGATGLLPPGSLVAQAAAPPLAPGRFSWVLLLRRLLVQTGSITGTLNQLLAPMRFKIAVFDTLALFLIITAATSLPSACHLIRTADAHVTVRSIAAGVRRVIRLASTAVLGVHSLQDALVHGGRLQVDAVMVALLIQVLVGFLLPLGYVYVVELLGKRAWLKSVQGSRSMGRPFSCMPQCSHLPLLAVTAILPALICMHAEVVASAMFKLYGPLLMNC